VSDEHRVIDQRVQETWDTMKRHRLANGGRGATAEQTEVGKFTQAVKDQDAMDAIRMAGSVRMDAASARVFLNELRALGWDVTRQCGGGL
jgi:hypothetical protein